MITPRERSALVFIAAYQSGNGGVSPTLEEIGAAIGIQTRGQRLVRMMRGLEARGFIRRIPRRARAIEVLATDVVMFRFDASQKELVAVKPS